MTKIDTKTKKIITDMLCEFLEKVAAAEHNLSMISNEINEVSIDMAKEDMSNGDYEHAYYKLGKAVHCDYLENNLKDIRNILEQTLDEAKVRWATTPKEGAYPWRSDPDLTKHKRPFEFGIVKNEKELGKKLNRYFDGESELDETNETPN